MNIALRSLLVVLLSWTAHAAQPRSTAAIAGHESLILLAGGAQPDDELPMIIGLHWSSGTPEAIAGDFDEIDFPARIILPRGKYPRRDGFSWFPSDYGQMNTIEQARVTLRVKDEISALIAAATKQYRTKGKPVITGVSYGGDLSFLIAIHHPEQIAAAVPVAARFPVEWLPVENRCKADCPIVYAMYGEKDPIIPIDDGRRAAERLTRRGFRVELREYEGAAHELSAKMKSDLTRIVKSLYDRSS